jgi:hypothetical protein
MNTEVNVTTTKILRFCGKVLFEAAVNTVKAALLLAIISGANLSGADLSGKVLTHIDVYRVLKLYNVTDPCLQHAVKKLLVARTSDASPPTHCSP